MSRPSNGTPRRGMSPVVCPIAAPNKTAAPCVNAADSAAKGGPGFDDPTSMAGATGPCPAGFEFDGKGGAANEPAGVGTEPRQPQPLP